MARRRRVYITLIVVALFILALLAFNIGVEALVSTTESQDVMSGAEERILGPENGWKAAVFVHGFVGAANNFNDLPDRLAENGWRVRVLRLPGHGTTPRDLRSVSTEDLRIAVRDALEEERKNHYFVALVGHSMGGALSTIVASEHKVDALVLGAPYFGVTHKWWYGLRPETWSRLVNPIIRWTYKGKLFLQVNKPEAKDEIVSYTWIPSEAMATLQDIGKKANDPELLSNVTAPVLWIQSKNDVAASYTAAEKAVDAMSSDIKKKIVLEESNHHIFWDYDAEQVATDVMQFLEEQAVELEPTPAEAAKEAAEKLVEKSREVGEQP